MSIYVWGQVHRAPIFSIFSSVFFFCESCSAQVFSEYSLSDPVVCAVAVSDVAIEACLERVRVQGHLWSGERHFSPSTELSASFSSFLFHRFQLTGNKRDPRAGDAQNPSKE
jgi:hypothetical protein